MTENVKAKTESQSLATAKPASFHHVGFAVASIEKLAPGFARSLGAHWNGEIIHDPSQEARVAFLYCGDQRIQQSNWWNRLGTRPRCIDFLTGVAACTISVMKWTLWMINYARAALKNVWW